MAPYSPFSDDYWTQGSGFRTEEYFRLPWLGCIALYLPVIFSLRHWMRNREPLPIKPFICAWNLALSFFSILGVALVLLDDWQLVFTAAKHEKDYKPTTRAICVWFAVSKLIEFGDTVLLALRKRPITFLHAYHHVTVALYCWSAVHLGVAFAHQFAFINLCVHGVMYLYYALTALFAKNRVLKKLRPFITSAQLSQMFVGVGITVSAMLRPEATGDPVHYNNALCALLMYFSYALLFGQFYVKNYVPNMQKKSEVLVAEFGRALRSLLVGDKGKGKGKSEDKMVTGADGAAGGESPPSSPSASPISRGLRHLHGLARARLGLRVSAGMAN
ncbi:unnamed protein product [Vitrella brassicaformis CCMP3155]|uniref:Elongation of fatty acids protein n=1 Tax=Vitrella brassicaformis (strain CCMP3155) TaxID=1169540 RepID=A0A0G4EK17_VITBC|nr:unnamed protein product [Vitrella brassicaformis CCMP3155]|mmetsp:Transcript_37057/g.92978  ORF Transcript_37057/g.92978 Transcript_37057/m.92978 type:complete len:331 (-) Transcript_37057:874-1866(-)|eukprot:CEL96745.1 unnamed protein product [Vitrella brassicaformis CCMP3155]